MRGRQLLRGWRRWLDSRSARGCLRSTDGSWSIPPDKSPTCSSPFFHSRADSNHGQGSFLLPDFRFAHSSCRKQMQASDLGLLEAAARIAGFHCAQGVAGARPSFLAVVLPGMRRYIVSSGRGSRTELTRKMHGWSSRPGIARGGRVEVFRRFNLSGYQHHQQRTIYGGGSGEQAVWALIGVNVFVFFLWQMAPPGFMTKHFQISWDALQRGRIHSLVTSAFSQASPHHLFANMIGLYFFGTEIAYMFGSKYLVGLYLAGGIAGSLGHILYWTYYVPWSKGIPRKYYDPRYAPAAMGASGAVNAIIILNVMLNPTRIVYVNFFIPVPAALLGLLLIGSDLWSARNEASGTSHAGHLGGALAGVIAFILR